MAVSPSRWLLAEEKGSPRWRLPVIILVALAIRMVVVCFTYRELPDADKLYERFGWEMGWIARQARPGRSGLRP